jgi:predicted negative regulator of RcsB-dependent stress response
MQVIEKPTRGHVTTEQPARTEDRDRAEQWLAWIKANQRRLSVAGGAAVVVAGAVWFGVSAKARRENFARRELDAARISAEAGNLPLAATDLSRVVSSYGGTSAGQEAVLLRAQVRMLQGQADLAVTELRDFIARGPKDQYRAPAYAGLAAALEQTGDPAGAGKAYEDGAEFTQYDLLKARLLISAGRAYTAAGDTTSAVRAYEQVVANHGETPMAPEARLRLAELGRYETPQAER